MTRAGDDTPRSGEEERRRTTAAKLAHELLSDMVRVRRMEEKCAELYSAAKIRGFLHLYVGEEAVAAGSLRTLADVVDYVDKHAAV